MKTKYFILLSAVIAMCTANLAFAKGSMSFVGVGSKSTIDTGATTYTASEMGMGGGLLFGVPVSARTNIEFGGLYVQRKVSMQYISPLNARTFEISTQLDTLVVPLMAKFGFLKVFTFGIGGFYAKVLKDKTTSKQIRPASTTSTSTSSGISASTVGVTGEFGLSIPLGSKWSFIAEARAFSEPKIKDSAVDYMGLGGLTYHFGGRK